MHPEIYRVNPDLPRPLKHQGPASGSSGQDLGSSSNKFKTDTPCLLRNIRGLRRVLGGWHRGGDTKRVTPGGWHQEGDTKRVPGGWQTPGDTERHRETPGGWHQEGFEAQDSLYLLQFLIASRRKPNLTLTNLSIWQICLIFLCSAISYQFGEVFFISRSWNSFTSFLLLVWQSTFRKITFDTLQFFETFFIP